MSIFDRGFNEWLYRDANSEVFSLIPVPTSNATITSPISSVVNPALITDGNLTGSLTMIEGLLQSKGFVSGSIGWKINSNGDVEFNSGTFRGTLTASSIHIPDENTTANSFHVETDGDTFWGCTQANFTSDNNNATSYVLKTGVAKFQSVSVVGTISGRSTATIAAAIDSSGHFIDANLDTSTKSILGDFVFGVSGAIKMITDVNNGLWISPTGILGKNAGNTTFAIDILGNATFAGTLSAASGTFGTITAGTLTGLVIQSLAATSSIDGQYFVANSVASASVNLALRGWSLTSIFSSTDYNTVAWTAGSFVASDGTTYAISAGNTGNISALNYIYLDIAVSTTVLQVATSYTAGNGKVLVAVAQNNSDTTSDATFQAFGGSGGQLLTVDNIAANSASTNEFISNTAQIANAIITSAKIGLLEVKTANINDLAVTNAKIDTMIVDKLTAGTITSKSITLAVSDGTGDSYIAAGKTDFGDTTNGFILGIDDSDNNKVKFEIGDSTHSLKWDGSALKILSSVLFGSLTLGDGSITSGTLTLSIADGQGDCYIAAGKTDFTNVDSGFIIGLDDSDSNKAKIYIGSSTQYLNWNGTNLEMAGYLRHLAGDFLYQSADTENQFSNVAPAQKNKQITVYNPGIYRVKFSLGCVAGGETAYGQIYKNGVAVGTLRSTQIASPNFDIFSEDLEFASADTVELWVYKDINPAANPSRVKNFRLYVAYYDTSTVDIN